MYVLASIRSLSARVKEAINGEKITQRTFHLFGKAVLNLAKTARLFRRF